VPVVVTFAAFRAVVPEMASAATADTSPPITALPTTERFLPPPVSVEPVETVVPVRVASPSSVTASR